MRELFSIKYITEKEAAYKYGFSQSWFQKRRKKKTPPPFIRLNGTGHILYPVEQLETWFKAHVLKDY